MKYTVIIPGNAMSKKNSKNIIWAGDGKPRIISSKVHNEWAKGALLVLKTNEFVGYPWHYPVRMSFHFIRANKCRFDFNNLTQGLTDLLQQAGIIEDDDMNHVIPGPNFSWSVDKNNPRTIVTIYSE